MRWFVYDIRTDLEDFVASFLEINDAIKFGKEKFGSYAYVTYHKMHEKCNKIGKARNKKR